MGIFSRIFSKNTEKSSQVRKWVEQEIEQVDTINPDVYALFVGLIHTTIQYGKYSIEDSDDKFSKVSNQYLGDATIFEVACYTYHRLENWLVRNEPEFKSDVALPISKWIIEKFAITLYLDEQFVGEIFREQSNRYQMLAGAGKSTEELHSELEQRILMTKGDKFNQNKLPKDPSSMVLDTEYIKLSMEKYEGISIATVIRTVEDFCSKNTKKQSKQRQNQQQNQQQNKYEQDYVYGLALLSQQDWVRACTAFTKVLSVNPKHYEALLQRGLLYVVLHQPVDAVQDFTVAIEINPNAAAPYLHRGKCYHRNFRKKDQSLADYSAAIILEPKEAAGYFGRGQLYDDIALSEEKQALEKNDHEKYAHISENFLGAIHDYSEVIALEPEHDHAYTNRGLIYARKARATKNVEFITKSIADFEKAMTLNWENGYLYRQQDEMKELLEQSSQSKN